MKHLYIQIRNELYLALKEACTFTVLELRDVYISQLNKPCSKHTARVYVDRIVQKMLELKAIEKKGKGVNGRNIFAKTSNFNNVTWGLKDEGGAIALLTPREATPKSQQRKSTQHKLEQLLTDCESRYIAAQHELVIYENLCVEFPIVSESFEKYKISHQKQLAKLLGEMKAIKSALDFTNSDDN